MRVSRPDAVNGLLEFVSPARRVEVAVAFDSELVAAVGEKTRNESRKQTTHSESDSVFNVLVSRSPQRYRRLLLDLGSEIVVDAHRFLIEYDSKFQLANAKPTTESVIAGMKEFLIASGHGEAIQHAAVLYLALEEAWSGLAAGPPNQDEAKWFGQEPNLGL